MKATRGSASAPPPPLPRLSPMEVVKFLSAAAPFGRGAKPVNFGGKHWKL